MSTSNHPVVSVVIPTHNREQFVGRAIRSVLAQTYTDFELIVVDDGSTDNTAGVVGSFKDPRIRFVRHEQNRGVSASRNTGIRMSRGEYVAFQDSDDEWLPQKLEKQLEMFARTSLPNLGVVACGKIRVSADGKKIVGHNIYKMSGQVYEEFLALKLEPGTQVLLVKKACLNGNLFDEELRAHEDWELCLRLSEKCQFDSLSEPLVIQYEHSGPRVSIPATPWKTSLLCIEKHKDELMKRPKAYANHRFCTFLAYYDNGLTAAAHVELFHCLLLDPWQPKRWVILLTLLISPKLTEFIRKIYRLSKRLFRTNKNKSYLS